MKIATRNILILLAVAVVLLSMFILSGFKNVEVLTDRKNYSIDSALRVNIKNNSSENICFSSCYPYYLEKKDDQWQSYDYGDCSKEDEIVKCISPRELKAFKIILSSVEKGYHRIKLPACIGCAVGDIFRSDKVFYSNSFEVN